MTKMSSTARDNGVPRDAAVSTSFRFCFSVFPLRSRIMPPASVHPCINSNVVFRSAPTTRHLYLILSSLKWTVKSSTFFLFWGGGPCHSLHSHLNPLTYTPLY